MIVVRIVGGLGNQMFQYAYAKALEQKGYEVKIDLSKFKNYTLHGGYQLNKYKTDLTISNSIFRFLSQIGIVKSIKEKNLLFDDSLLSLKGNCFMKGYFQTEKYFLPIREVLLEQFQIEQEKSDSTKKLAQQIKELKNTCSLHIRRGDYISNEKAQKTHGSCSLEYYKKAIQHIEEKDGKTHFFVFSDDINWVKKELKIDDAYYVDHQVIPHEDLYLMSLCQHNITANSSFSWWGAWLNKNPNKTVIAPEKWFVATVNEVASENWIKL